MKRLSAASGLLAILSLITGCAGHAARRVGRCEGMGSAAAYRSVLTATAADAVSLKAGGRCVLEYRDGGKLRKESFPVKLWADPPAGIYLQGDVAFDPRAVEAGTNEQEFWLSVKAAGTKAYWWGRWPFHAGGDLMFDPALLREALGLGPTADDGNYMILHRQADFDVLVRKSPNGPEKRIYVDTCNYRMRKIEYLAHGEVAASAAMSEYKPVAGDFYVPTVLSLTAFDRNGPAAIIQIKLDSVKPAAITGRQAERMFSRPEPRGIEDVYLIVEGRAIPQSD